MLCIISETKCGNICQWKLKFFKVCFCLTLSQELEIIRQRWLRLRIVQSAGYLPAGSNQTSNFATITKLCCHCSKSKIQNLRNILTFISLLFLFFFRPILIFECGHLLIYGLRWLCMDYVLLYTFVFKLW